MKTYPSISENACYQMALCQITDATLALEASDEAANPAADAAALDFCRRNLPDAVKTTETLDTTKYREFAEKMQKAGAETLPVGIETVPQKENFSIKF